MWVGSTSDLFSERRVKDRVRLYSVLFAFGFGVLILRLFYLQVLKGDDFALVSESNRTQTIFLGAPRGDIFDTNGVPLVTNRPSWSLMYSGAGHSDDDQDSVIDRLRPFLARFPSRWEKRIKTAFKTKQLVRLVEDVPSPMAFGMREMGELLPGLRMELEFRRDYPNGIPGIQLLGYLSEIDEDELKEDLWYARKLGDLIGKMGLEKILDTQLRGRDGGMLIEVDSVGRLKRVIRSLPYEDGNSVQVTLDSKIQKVAQEAFEETSTKRGAAVALDVNTGAIRAWVSAPTFDPSGSLVEDVLDSNLPFFDRVYKGSYPPGSLYKIITAIAGLEAGVIRLKDKIKCVGYVKLKDRRLIERKYGCWRRHGEVNFWRAISESCDSYFYLLGHRVGVQRIYETSLQFGLGKETQDLLPNENPGIIPNASWKRKKGYGGWSTGDTYNMSIGQGFVTSTPLQMAMMMSGVVSRGDLWKPYLIERVMDSNNQTLFETKPTLMREIKCNDSTWDRILYALKLVVDKGTGRVSKVRHLDVYGKTGTAQNPHGEDHAWFLAAAGYRGEKPRLAVCVFVENGGNGGSAAAPIARKIIESALPPLPTVESI